MLAASLERISIGLLLIRIYNFFFVREASSPCNGNHFSSYSVTKILRKIRATTFTERLRKITREGPGAPGMSNAASN